jgi:hypothetical protein
VSDQPEHLERPEGLTMADPKQSKILGKILSRRLMKSTKGRQRDKKTPAAWPKTVRYW